MDLMNVLITNQYLHRISDGGGGGKRWDDWIDDGKTHIFLEIPAEGRMDVQLMLTQTVAHGVTIDWGDGSDPQTLNYTGNVNTTHTYASVGNYVITLEAIEGCDFALGTTSSDFNITGNIGKLGSRAYSNMFRAVEFGNNVVKINSSAFLYCGGLERVKFSDSVTDFNASAIFENCTSLKSVVIPEGTTTIGYALFNNCTALADVVLPNSLTTISTSAFGSCVALSSITIPGGVTSIGSSAFNSCLGMKFYDFTKHTAIPTLSATNAFNNIPSDCEIRVPAALVDEWKAATNWSTYASKIVGV